MENRKYEDLDKSITKTIMQDLKGVIIDTVCCACGGIDPAKQECENCNGEGHYEIEY